MIYLFKMDRHDSIIFYRWFTFSYGWNHGWNMYQLLDDWPVQHVFFSIVMLTEDRPCLYLCITFLSLVGLRSSPPWFPKTGHSRHSPVGPVPLGFQIYPLWDGETRSPVEPRRLSNMCRSKKFVFSMENPTTKKSVCSNFGWTDQAVRSSCVFWDSTSWSSKYHGNTIETELETW